MVREGQEASAEGTGNCQQERRNILCFWLERFAIDSTVSHYRNLTKFGKRVRGEQSESLRSIPDSDPCRMPDRSIQPRDDARLGRQRLCFASDLAGVSEVGVFFLRDLSLENGTEPRGVLRIQAEVGLCV